MSILDRAELLLRAKDYSGSGEWLDASGNGHNAQFGSTSGADTNDPTFLDFTTKGKHARLPGTSGNYFSTADVNLWDADLANLVQPTSFTNLFAGNNSTLEFESERVYQGADSGFRSIKGTATNTGWAGPYNNLVTRVPGTAATAYSFSFWAYHEVNATLTFRAAFTWYDGAQASLGGQNGTGVSVPPGVWTKVTVSGTSPASTAYIRNTMYCISGHSINDVLYYSAPCLVQASDPVDTWVPSLRIVGDLDMRAKVDSALAQSALIAHWPSTSQKGYLMAIESSGYGTIYYSTDGTTTSTMSSVSTVLNDESGPLEYRFTLDLDDGSGNRVATYYVDGVQKKVTTTAGTISSLFSGSGAVEVGSIYAGTSFLSAADVYYAEVRDGIDGPVVARYDVDDNGVSDTSFTGVTDGRTWTVNRGSSGAVTTIVDRDAFLFTTDDYFSVPDHANLDFNTNESFTVFGVAASPDWTDGTPATLVGKNTAVNNQGWSIYGHDTSGVLFRLNDGTNNDIDTGTEPTANAIAVVAARRDTVANEVEIFVDGSGTGSPATEATSDLSNSEAVSIGALNVGGTVVNFFEGTISDVVLFREALTDNEIYLVSLILNNNAPDPATLHGDALLDWILTYEDRSFTANSELVGILNEINGTTGKEYAEARGTYLNEPPAG